MSYVGSLGRNRGKRNMFRLVGSWSLLYLLLETGVWICVWSGSGLVGRGSGWVGRGMVRIRSRFVQRYRGRAGRWENYGFPVGLQGTGQL